MRQILYVALAYGLAACDSGGESPGAVDANQAQAEKAVSSGKRSVPVAQLPAGQRAAVVLFYYADASVRDIARRTGTSQLAVRANLSRGRRRLKQMLGDRDD